MIFPCDPPQQASFWMKNTVIPLDIVFIGTDAADAQHRRQRACPIRWTPLAVGRAGDGAVLELNGGRAAQLGIVPGRQGRLVMARRPLARARALRIG